jgi:hypothetical protein
VVGTYVAALRCSPPVPIILGSIQQPSHTRQYGALMRVRISCRVHLLTHILKETYQKARTEEKAMCTVVGLSCKIQSVLSHSKSLLVVRNVALHAPL